MQKEVLLWTSSKYPGSKSMLFQENINYGFSPDYFGSESVLRDSYHCVNCVRILRSVGSSRSANHADEAY